MAEISTAAYQDLRNYIQTNWKYIELQNESGTSIVRLSPSDSRVTSVIEGNKVKLTIVLKGSDADIVEPLTFVKSVIYNVATGGTPFSTETYEPFTLVGADDEITVNHSIQIPVIA